MMKYLNLAYFNGVASIPIVGKAEILSQLLLLTKATTSIGESALEKAFKDSLENPKLAQSLSASLKNIIAWLLLNSGDYSGPVQKHIKGIEQTCKYIIMVASEIRDAEKIQDVMSIYRLLLKNILGKELTNEEHDKSSTEIESQSNIPTALAFIKARNIHKVMDSIFEYLLVNDEIAEKFVFEQNGLNNFMKMLLDGEKESAEEEEKREDGFPIVTNSAVTSTVEQNVGSLNCLSDSEDNELLDFIQSRLNKPTSTLPNAEVKGDEMFTPKNMSRNVTTGDFVPNEFARTMTLVDSNISKAKEIVSNMDWSVNKKGYRQRLISQKFEPEHNDEIWLLFKLNRFVEIKEIQIGFTNFWTIETEVYVEPSSVTIEAGMTEHDLVTATNISVCSLDKLEDKGFANFGVTVYGKNMYSFSQQSNNDDMSELINANFDSLQSIKARYIKVRIRNNFISCLENSPLCNKYMKPRAIGINYCSIMGYDISNVGNIESTIVDMQKETASKVLGLLFGGKFSKTLSRVSVRQDYIEFIKNNLSKMMKLLAVPEMSNVIGLILQTSVSYNKEMGDWIISKCLDLHCDYQQVSLLYTLIKSNPKEFYDRQSIIKDFIFERCKELALQDEISDTEAGKLLPFFDTFLDLVTLYGKNLHLKEWYKQVFDTDDDIDLKAIADQLKLCLTMTSSELCNLMHILFTLKQGSDIQDGYMKFVLPFIVNGSIKVDNSESLSYWNQNSMTMEPVHVIDNFISNDIDNDKKALMLSLIVSNLNSSKCPQIIGLVLNRRNIEEIHTLLQSVQEEEQFDEAAFESKLEFWANSLSSEGLRSMIEPKMGLKLYLALAALNLTQPLKLTVKQKRLVISLIIKLTIGFQEKETALAEKIIEDLDHLKDKKDIEFVNNILTPLLKAENKVPVCFDFLDTKNQTHLAFNKVNEQATNTGKYYNFLSRPELAEISKHFSALVGRNYNDQKLLVSKWKLISSFVGRPNAAGYDDMLKKMTNKPAFFILIEGYSKPSSSRSGHEKDSSRKHAQKSVIGIYNRNAIFETDGDYAITTSNDNFCFITTNNPESRKDSHYAWFSCHPSSSLLKFKSQGKVKSINVAEGFMKLKYPEESTQKVGNLTKIKTQYLSHSENYVALKDFKEERMEVWILDTMLEASENSQQKASSMNMDEFNLKDKFEPSKALGMFRQNWFLVPRNLALPEVLSEGFGFSVSWKALYNGKTLDEIYQAQRDTNIHSDNIIDVTINFEEFVDKVSQQKDSGHHKSSKDSGKRYLAVMGIFDSFEKLEGVNKLISITQQSVSETWKNKELAEKWSLWLYELESFTQLPLFFQFFIKDKYFKDLLFEILAGVPDQEASNSQQWSEKQAEAVKMTYKIIKEMFQVSKDPVLRQKATETGLIDKILVRLKEVTGEYTRKYVEDEEEEEEKEAPATEDKPKEEKVVKNYEKKKRKGVGYTTGVGKTWNVSQYIKNHKVKNEQISYLIDILANFFRTKEWVPSTETASEMTESCLLPLIENAFRTGSLLDMVKFHKLYISYLRLVRVFAKNSKTLAQLLIELDPKYKPKQLEPIYKLLSKLNDLANIYNSCLQSQGNNESEKEAEILIKEIKKTYKSVTRAVEKIKSIEDDNFYENALALPLDQKYPLLLKNLRFDNMDMRNEAGNYVHHYIKNYSANVSSSKINRLAQELADLSTALPTDHTNAIFVRVDKERVDLMKALVMGAEGTPYAHGAFEFDIYCNQNYPKDPPKMNLTTTGSSAVRFNPNLYACGKVCLSLLGTWRGNATENWDPKISTILQVLMSTQAIIMSEEIYFNEPGFEGEAGTPDGERKNEGYSNIIKYCNIKYAMLGQIQNPSKGFETVIRRHFYLKRDEIMKTCKQWIKEASENEALYTGLVSDHNYNWCAKFKPKGSFEKMLREVVDELETELYKLPEPSGQDLLKAKKHKTRKAHQKAKDINEGAAKLDNIDVDSDEESIVTTKHEMNVDKEDFKDRWSRYIGAMGMEAVAKQATSNVFVSGASATGIEISKNVVLAGCKTFTLHDTRKATIEDLSGQFFLQQPDIGKNRAEASIKRLQQLNYYVKCSVSTASLPDTEEELKKQGYDKYNIICLSQCSLKTAIAINNFARKHGIQFILFDVYGPFSRVFNDFGDEFIVLDKDGEDIKERWIKSISNDTEGLVEVLDVERHDLDDGDKVAITEVIGMDLKQGETTEFKSNSINQTIHDIKIVSPFSFKIGDTTKFEEYVRNGKITQVKVPKTNNFKSLEECLKSKEIPYDQNLSMADFEKMAHLPIVHACFSALDSFIQEKETMPRPWNKDDAEAFFKHVEEEAKKIELEINDKCQNLARLFSFTCRGVFNPLCAFIGGFVAQEIVKAMTQKYTPLNQFCYFDSSEACPKFDYKTDLDNFEEYTKGLLIEPKEHRSDGLRIVIGGEL